MTQQKTQAPQSNTGKTKRRKVAALTGAALVAAGTLYGLSNLYSALEVESAPQYATYEAGTLTIGLDAGSTVSTGKVLMAAADRSLSALAVENTGSSLIGKLEITPQVEGELFQGVEGVMVKLKGCTQAFNDQGECPAGTAAESNFQDGESVIDMELPPGERYHLLVDMRLPQSLPNDAQGKSGTVAYSITATQKFVDKLPQPESR